MNEANVIAYYREETYSNGVRRADQEFIIRRLCRTLGMKVLAILADDVPGSNSLEQRPGLQQVIRRAENTGDVCLLVLDPDWAFVDEEVGASFEETVQAMGSGCVLHYVETGLANQ